MRSIHFSDLECGREYFLCWRPSGVWFNTNLVLLENGCDVGSYHPNLGRREDGLFDHGSGDTLLLIPGISVPIALLILWIGTLADFLSEDCSRHQVRRIGLADRRSLRTMDKSPSVGPPFHVSRHNNAMQRTRDKIRWCG